MGSKGPNGVNPSPLESTIAIGNSTKEKVVWSMPGWNGSPGPGVDRLAVLLRCQLVLRLKFYKPPGCFCVNQSQPQLTSKYRIRYLRGNDCLLKMMIFVAFVGVKEMIDRVHQRVAVS